MLEYGFAIDANSMVLKKLNDGITEITWPNKSSYLAYPKVLDTVSGYIEIFESRNYAFVLNDGAIIQVEYLFNEKKEIKKHRLSYHPCPLDIQEDFELPFLDNFYDRLAKTSLSPKGDTNPDANKFDAVNTIKLRSSLRFDYCVNSAKENHPASHLTLLSTDCRIPMRAPLSFKSFIKILFESFYPSIWDNSCWQKNIYGELEHHQMPKTISLEQLSRHHVNWGLTN